MTYIQRRNSRRKMRCRLEASIMQIQMNMQTNRGLMQSRNQCTRRTLSFYLTTRSSDGKKHKISLVSSAKNTKRIPGQNRLNISWWLKKSNRMLPQPIITIKEVVHMAEIVGMVFRVSIRGIIWLRPRKKIKVAPTSNYLPVLKKYISMMRFFTTRKHWLTILSTPSATSPTWTIKLSVATPKAASCVISTNLAMKILGAAVRCLTAWPTAPMQTCMSSSLNITHPGMEPSLNWCF